MIYILSVAFVLGIATQTVFHFSLATVFLFLVCGLGIGAVTLGGKEFSEEVSKRQKLIFIGLVIFSLGTIRAYFSIPAETISADKYVGGRASFSGVIVSEPDLRDDLTRYVVKPDEKFMEFQNAKILVTADRFPKFDYGDLVQVLGKIQFPEAFKSDLGRTFDYPKYLAKDGIRYVLYRPQMILVEKAHNNSLGPKILMTLFSVKKRFVENIERVMTEPYSSLAGGITLGLKQSLGKELLYTFRTAGIIHIVVLSGYNMTIILAGVLYLLSGFRRGIILTLAAILTVLFTAIVGFSATVLRASIMALLAILARFLGRPVLAMRTLFVTGVAMLLWNPLILFYDPSFQLSFLATFGLIAVSPVVEKRFLSLFSFFSHISNASPKWKQVFREIIVATIATQIFVLPALIYLTGQFSIVSLPVNLLVLPLIPTAMFFTGIVGVLPFIPLGFVSVILSKIAALPAYTVLEFIIKVSELSAKIPLAAIKVENIPLWLVFLVYAGYGWVLWKESKNQRWLLIK